MSSLIKRRMPSGRSIWYVYYWKGGHRHSRSTHTGDKQIAQTIQAQIDKDLLQDRFHITRNLPLSQVFERRIEYLATQNRPPGTIKIEKRVLSYFLNFLGEDLTETPPQEIFESYKQRRRNAGITPAGINLELRHIKAAFNWGAKHNYCQTVKISPVKQEKRLPKFLDDDEVGRFLDAVDDEKFRLIYETYLRTGGRKEEISSLTWRDVNFDRGVVVFRKTKAAQEREVPLHPLLMEGLTNLRASNNGSDDGSVFGVKSDLIYRRCLAYMDKAGILDPEKRGLHVLRHTFASRLIMRGVDMATVSRLLGHSSIQVTMDHYTHLTKKHLEDAIKKLPL